MRTWLPTTVRSWHECWPFRTRLYCLIVAGRNNDLRTLYSHWTGQIRKSRLGVLLVPDVDYDGDLLGVRVFKFRLLQQQCLLAYRILDEESIKLLTFGPHENFYRDLKRQDD